MLVESEIRRHGIRYDSHDAVAGMDGRKHHDVWVSMKAVSHFNLGTALELMLKLLADRNNVPLDNFKPWQRHRLGLLHDAIAEQCWKQLESTYRKSRRESGLPELVMFNNPATPPPPPTRNIYSLRVRPETLCRITEFSEHESNGRELDEGERVAVEVLPVLGQSAAAVEPGDGAFDHPTPGLDDEALHPIGSLDDLGLEIGQDAGQGAVKDRPLIGAVGEQFPEKGKQTEQGRQQRETAVAILNVGGGADAVQQQALRIDQNMPLLALDQLAGIEAVAVDASPPFSALFTL